MLSRWSHLRRGSGRKQTVSVLRRQRLCNWNTPNRSFVGPTVIVIRLFRRGFFAARTRLSLKGRTDAPSRLSSGMALRRSSSSTPGAGSHHPITVLLAVGAIDARASIVLVGVLASAILALALQREATNTLVELHLPWHQDLHD